MLVGKSCGIKWTKAEKGVFKCHQLLFQRHVLKHFLNFILHFFAHHCDAYWRMSKVTDKIASFISDCHNTFNVILCQLDIISFFWMYLIWLLSLLLSVAMWVPDNMDALSSINIDLGCLLKPMFSIRFVTAGLVGMYRCGEFEFPWGPLIMPSVSPV